MLKKSSILCCNRNEIQVQESMRYIDKTRSADAKKGIFHKVLKVCFVRTFKMFWVSAIFAQKIRYSSLRADGVH